LIGRGALGKPWVFDREFEHLSKDAQHSYKFRVIERHLDLIEEHMNERFALVQAKKHLAWYIAGVKGSAKGRNTVFTFEDIKLLRQWFRDYWPEAGMHAAALPANDTAEPELRITE
jgi:tRNA-dihydrouridine synthase B